MATAGRTTGRTAAGHDDDFQPLAMRRGDCIYGSQQALNVRVPQPVDCTWPKKTLKGWIFLGKFQDTSFLGKMHLFLPVKTQKVSQNAYLLTPEV